MIAAITSCTNTSNPSVMLGAGILAKKAVERGLTVKPWVKTSLAPGSKVVRDYLQRAGLIEPYLEQLHFDIVGYGCTTCIGNSGPVPEAIAAAIAKNNLVASAILSGNRNFEGRINPVVRFNYLASPPLVVAYAIAGTIDFDVEKEPLGDRPERQAGFPQRHLAERRGDRGGGCGLDRFGDVPSLSTAGSSMATSAGTDSRFPKGNLFQWDENSEYVKAPPFFDGVSQRRRR